MQQPINSPRPIKCLYCRYEFMPEPVVTKAGKKSAPTSNARAAATASSVNFGGTTGRARRHWCTDNSNDDLEGRNRKMAIKKATEWQERKNRNDI